MRDQNSLRAAADIAVGALLLGMLWRLRGSHGWGAAWGVLSCGFVFMLFLTAVSGKKERVSFAVLSAAALSFMLTTPSWGTFLSAVTGIQALSAKGNDAVTEVFVHPLSAAALMLCLGFGMTALIGVLLVVRFVLRDKQAAKTGAVVCGAFALAITAADVWFFLDGGGYHGVQGFALPDWITAWSAWEYCTGFLAGGIITAYVRRLPVTADVALPLKLQGRARNVIFYVLFFIGGIGLNVVRTLLVRLDRSTLQIPAVIFAALAVIAVSVLACRRWGFLLDCAPSAGFARALVAFFVGYYVLLYLFAYEPQIREMRMLHNMLVLVSFVCVSAWCLVRTVQPEKTVPTGGRMS